MTIGNHEMNDDEQNEFFKHVDSVNRAGSALKIIAWAIGGMAVAGLSVAIWVLNVNWAQAEHGKKIEELTPRVSALEKRGIQYDAAPPVSREQFHGLDMRLGRMEQSATTLKEQTALILETLKKLESRP